MVNLIENDNFFLNSFEKKIIEKAKVSELKGLNCKNWYEAKKYFNKVQEYYSILPNFNSRLLLNHGKVVQNQSFPKITFLELKDKFYYVENIFKYKNSLENLCSLALDSVNLASKLNKKTEKEFFLEYSKKLFFLGSKNKLIY